MALLAEDGTGLAGANGYVTVAYVTAHHQGRGRTDWVTANTVQKEAAIVRATDYLDKRFGRRFLGTRLRRDQGLAWPRLGAYDHDEWVLDGVPPQLAKATAEYALIALRQGELEPAPPLPVPTTALDGEAGSAVHGEVQSTTEVVVGAVEESITYRDPSAAAYRRQGGSSLVSTNHLPEYPAADLWVEELLRSGSSRELARG